MARKYKEGEFGYNPYGVPRERKWWEKIIDSIKKYTGKGKPLKTQIEEYIEKKRSMGKSTK